MSDDVWTVVFAAAAVDDLALIEQHLIEAYQSFGEGPEDAALHAAARIEAMLTTAERLATAPFRGEAHDDLLPGLRHLSLESAIYWFTVDKPTRQIQVLALFFGGQDHQRRMMVRLLRQAPE